NKPKQINQCLECFYNHSNEHPDGWGLATMQSDEFVVDKEPVKASCSEHLKDILSHPVVGKNVFAHIRLATVGEIVSPNCHPFIEADDNNRSWMLIHNGTIFQYPELDKYREKEKGNTDSERILLFIIDKVNEFEKAKGAPSTIKERFNLLTGIIADLSYNNKLNIMIYDGDLTYIHSNMRDSLYYLKNEDGFLVASTPLDDDENWKAVELNKLFALIDGNIIFESEEHDNEFIFTEAHEKLIEEFLKTTNQDETND
ncbi:class II glutamine amidotransferase, partial [Methanobrevibacter sp.]